MVVFGTLVTITCIAWACLSAMVSNSTNCGDGTPGGCCTRVNNQFVKLLLYEISELVQQSKKRFSPSCSSSNPLGLESILMTMNSPIEQRSGFEKMARY